MLSDRLQPDPDRIFSGFDFGGRKSVIAAVSGGSDSLALLFLLKDQLARAAGIELRAVTIDHGLRPESAIEAQDVASLCAQHSIPHRVLRWEGEKRPSGVSAAARGARHRLLAEAARAVGTDLVLTGHTRDDQAETVLMRQVRGDGRGLAGMAPATLYDGSVWIVRPLLDTGREALRAFLRARNIAWIDDPTNEKPEYERARVRRELATADKPERRKRSLLNLARRHGAVRLEDGRRAAEIISSEVARISPGLIRLRSRYGSAGTEAHLYALRILIACVGGTEHLPDERRAAELIRRFSNGPFRATLSRTVVDARPSGIFLHREFRGAGPAPIPVCDGEIWDGRYRIRSRRPAEPGLIVAPLGRERARETALGEADVPPGPVRGALAVEPALHRGGADFDRLGRDGGAQEVAAIPVLAPWAKFLPCFDLAPARAMAALLGADPVPEPPFAGHNRR